MTDGKKIGCTKDGSADVNGSSDTVCKAKSSGGGAGKGLIHAYGAHAQADTTKVDADSSTGISKQMSSNLSREEKGVVSSVFAKVIEGAEILRRKPRQY